jgi:ABC-type lipoprotein release transport system permease subunit
MMDVKKLATIAGSGGSKDLRVQKQISLPWSDAFRISIKNVVMRLGRAAITATGIVLGVAFLNYILADRVFSEGVERARVRQEQQFVAATEAARGGAEGANPAEQAQANRREAEAQAAASAQERRARQTWLVIMSLLVCGIGITNSMLMSVTERFREIGTMKCLGALDSFVVRLFLIESAVIGTLGSVAGLILGVLFCWLRYSLTYGFSVSAKVQWPGLLGYMVFTVIIGAVLSLVSAIAPSIRAARMPPAAALRSEI